MLEYVLVLSILRILKVNKETMPIDELSISGQKHFFTKWTSIYYDILWKQTRLFSLLFILPLVFKSKPKRWIENIPNNKFRFVDKVDGKYS